MQDIIKFLVAHWALSATFLVLLIAYLGFEIFNSNNHNSITAQAAIDLINHQHAIILDLRSKEQYDDKHIIEAINIPANNFTEQQKKIHKYAKKPVMYCYTAGF